MKQQLLLSGIFFIQCIAASGNSFLHLRGGDQLASGMKILTPGTVKFSYVISEGEPSVTGGVVAILIDRRYKPGFPQNQIPGSIHLVRGTGIGGKPTGAGKLLYKKYHSQGITNQNLRNKFHVWFGNSERTDEPFDSRRRKFLFRNPGNRSYRTVLLLKYSRGSSESTTTIPFQMGFSQSQEKAKITVVDLKDGVSDPISLSVTLLPK